ncbi:NifB/NifX family molybdenum-iron cluster-binding protein [Teredinibacter haidensis]|uniref:NifB/NifX family molybdenum-iron cluster-binding protein n=1 Tax=Teredinibacter haidensis TaxID=2731755 RepID=UPI000949028E|nr:NifB/NifX family molybdenum-iron cluster-binding protein [Teredinibacter haidensis]
MASLTRKLSVITSNDIKPILKIAFATDNNRMVNQHFGSAKTFAIYGVNSEASSLLTIAEFCDIGVLDMEDKLVHKLELLDDCVAVYCRACGASAVKQLLERNIQPLKVPEDIAIKQLLKAFRQELNERPSYWLAKAILRQRSADRIGSWNLEY